MRKLAIVSLCLGLALVAGVQPALAQRSQAATLADIQGVEYDLQNLDDSLAALSTSHARYREFQDRADEIRDDVTFLKVQIRRGQRSNPPVLGATKGEVDNLRRSIRTLQSDIDNALDRRLSGSATLPEGTEMQVRLEQPLSSKTAKVEDRVDASVAVPVVVDGRVVVPAGTRVQGTVTGVQRGERPVKGGKLELRFDSIYLDDRTRKDLRAQVVSVKDNLDTGDSAKRAGIGAVIGGVIGKVIGGTKGAIIGAVLGGGGALAAGLGEDVELPAGTILALRLERPVDVTR